VSFFILPIVAGWRRRVGRAGGVSQTSIGGCGRHSSWSLCVALVFFFSENPNDEG